MREWLSFLRLLSNHQSGATADDHWAQKSKAKTNCLTAAARKFDSAINLNSIQNHFSLKPVQRPAQVHTCTLPSNRLEFILGSNLLQCDSTHFCSVRLSWGFGDKLGPSRVRPTCASTEWSLRPNNSPGHLFEKYLKNKLAPTKLD